MASILYEVVRLTCPQVGICVSLLIFVGRKAMGISLLHLPLRFPTFTGGVHPDDNKRHTAHLKIEELSAPKKMIFPTLQNAGAPGEVVVEVGDSVKVGQLLIKQCGIISANHHCSVSGTVIAIEPHLHPCGSHVKSVIVENDEKYEVFRNIKPLGHPENLTKEEIIKAVSNAGIVGMGGAAFPTHIKLSPPSGKKINHIIINGAECEPFLTSDYRVMLEDTDELLIGCGALLKAVDASECIIVAESNKKDAIAKIKQNPIYQKNEKIKTAIVKTKYPQGGEKQLLSAVLKKEVPPGGLPADIGAVVVNIDTCAAVARSITTGMPLITRVVTVSGGAVANKRNFKVRIGTPVADAINAVGGFTAEPAKILLGGPMMGVAIHSTDIPVTKGVGAILALTEKDVGIKVTTNCTQCGKCVDVCPMNLMPTIIDRYCENFDAEMLEKLNIADCIECGSCTFICPARRDPLQRIRTAKKKINAFKK